MTIAGPRSSSPVARLEDRLSLRDMSELEEQRERENAQGVCRQSTHAHAISCFNATAVTITAVYTTTGSLAATGIAAGLSVALVWIAQRDS